MYEEFHADREFEVETKLKPETPHDTLVEEKAKHAAPSPKSKVSPHEKLSSVATAALMLNVWKDSIKRIEEFEDGLMEPTQEELEMLHSGPGTGPGGVGGVSGVSGISGISASVLSKIETDDVRTTV